MALEDLTGAAKYIGDLNPLWPDGLDPKGQGDDHIRGIKNVLLNTFGAVLGPFDVSHACSDNIAEVINAQWRFLQLTRFQSQLVVGASSAWAPITIGSTTPATQILGTSAPGSGIAIARASNDLGASAFYFIKVRNTDPAVHTNPILAGDIFSQLIVAGSNGVGLSGSQTFLRVLADGNWSNVSNPTRIVLQTTKSGAVVSTEAFVIDSDNKTFIQNKSGSMQRAGISPQNVSGGTRSIGLADLNQVIRNIATASLTIADIGDSGDQILVRNALGSTLTLLQGAGVTLTWLKGGSESYGTRTIAPSSVVTLYRENAGNWSVYGNGIS